MNTYRTATSRAVRQHGAMVHGLMMGCTAVALLLMSLMTHAADAGGAAPAAKTAHVKLEAIPGSSVKRIILTEKAANRLGIVTDKVREQVVVRRQMLGGLVIPPMDKQSRSLAMVTPAPAPAGTLESVGFGRNPAAGAAEPTLKTVVAPMAVPAPTAGPPPMPKPSASGEVWVLVNLSVAEWERTAKDKPVRLLALGTREPIPTELLARPSGMAPTEDLRRSMLSVYYMVPGKDHGLLVNNRLRVEMPMVGTEDKQKVVPYSAVYYDGKGAPWVYVNTRPLVFERQGITIERIVGDLAVLSQGPEVGTSVVTVGASILFGTEIFGK